MLQTNLKHINTREDLKTTLEENENVMVCCGRMGPMCLPVYDVMEKLETSGEYEHISFRDMPFDSPESDAIRSLPETRGFMSLPFTVYFKNGKVVAATSSIQSKDQVTDILDQTFTK